VRSIDGSPVHSLPANGGGTITCHLELFMHRSVAILAFVFLFSLGLPSPVLAQLDAQNVLRDLASDDFNTRERATRELLINNKLTPQDIAPVFRQATTPEQRARLLDVARHHFLRGEQEKLSQVGGQGSLGVSLQSRPPGDPEDPASQQGGIRIAATYPGFPAYYFLQAGDVIIAVDDQALGDAPFVQNRFVEIVQSRGVGGTLSLKIDRNGQTLDMAIPLAGFVGLVRMFAGSPWALQPEFQQKWNKVQTELFPGVDPGETLAVDLGDAAAAVPPDPVLQQEIVQLQRQVIIRGGARAVIHVDAAAIRRAEAAKQVEAAVAEAAKLAEDAARAVDAVNQAVPPDARMEQAAEVQAEAVRSVEAKMEVRRRAAVVEVQPQKAVPVVPEQATE